MARARGELDGQGEFAEHVAEERPSRSATGSIHLNSTSTGSASISAASRTVSGARASIVNVTGTTLTPPALEPSHRCHRALDSSAASRMPSTSSAARQSTSSRMSIGVEPACAARPTTVLPRT